LNAKFLSAAIKLLSITIAFFSNFYLASLLSKNDFGLYSVLVSLLSLSLVFSNMGLSLSIIDLFPKAQTANNLKLLKRKIYYYSIFSSFIVGFLSSCYLIFSGIVPFDKSLLLITVLIFVVFFQNIHSSNISILRSLQSFRLALTLESIIFNLTLILSIYLLFKGNIIELLNSFLIAAFLALTLSTIFSNLNISSFTNINTDKEIKDLEINLSKLWPFMLLGLVEVITTNLDVLLVRQFYGYEETANYFLAKKMLIAFTFFWFIYNFIYTPKLSKLFMDKHNIDYRAVVKILRLKWPVLLISTICMAIVNLFYNDIIILFDLNEYTDAKPYILFFSIFAFVHILTGPVVSFLNVTGLSSYSFRVVSFGAVVFLITFYPLQYYYGVLGILIALNLSLIAWKILGVLIIRKVTGFNLLVGSYIDE
jgi:O-antigen/teichoic acid export membrane protein